MCVWVCIFLCVSLCKTHTHPGRERQRGAGGRESERDSVGRERKGDGESETGSAHMFQTPRADEIMMFHAVPCGMLSHVCVARLQVGGPDVLTFQELGEMSAREAGRDPKQAIRHRPVWLIWGLVIIFSLLGYVSRCAHLSPEYMWFKRHRTASCGTALFPVLLLLLVQALSV